MEMVTSTPNVPVAAMNTDASVLSSVRSWFHDHLAREDGRLGRPYGRQAICPFAAESLDRGAVKIVVVREEINDCDELIRICQSHTYQEFEGVSRPSLESMVLVFPDLTSHLWHWLDETYKRLKDDFVQRHIMIAQFYPTCDVRSVHNPLFVVGTSPYPLIAVRRMMPHDILFLADKKAWFEVFAAKFGHLMVEEGNTFPQKVLTAYREAAAKHLPASTTSACTE